ncbi:MAG: hypothetical protein ACJAV2_004690 [Myxococcota bacterium]|jgi:hypothetical protein
MPNPLAARVDPQVREHRFHGAHHPRVFGRQHCLSDDIVRRIIEVIATEYCETLVDQDELAVLPALDFMHRNTGAEERWVV